MSRSLRKSCHPRSLAAATLALLSLTVLSLLSVPPAEAADPKPEPIRVLKAWGSHGSAPGQFDIPIGIAINQADEVFITDHYNNRVQKFDTDGKLLGHFAVLPNPGGIGIDKSGNIYLSHFRAALRSEDAPHRISMYSPEGKLLLQWGKTGTGDGEFDCPGGLAIGTGVPKREFGNETRIYVADQTNHRIQVFDNTGKFVTKWGEYGTANGQFGGKASVKSRTGGPQFVALDSAGNVWTTEGMVGRLQKFTPEGKHLLSWGDNQNKPGSFGGPFTGFKDRSAGGLQGPIALCFDKHDRLWVSAVGGRVQQFSQEGKYLRGLVAEQGSKPGQFYAPHGLAFDSRGHLYVVDAFNHRIQKFEVPQ